MYKNIRIHHRLQTLDRNSYLLVWAKCFPCLVTHQLQLFTRNKIEASKVISDDIFSLSASTLTVTMKNFGELNQMGNLIICMTTFLGIKWIVMTFWELQINSRFTTELQTSFKWQVWKRWQKCTLYMPVGTCTVYNNW